MAWSFGDSKDLPSRVESDHIAQRSFGLTAMEVAAGRAERRLGCDEDGMCTGGKKASV